MALKGYAGVMLLVPLVIMICFVVISAGSAPTLQGSNPITFCSPDKQAAGQCAVSNDKNAITYYCNLGQQIGGIIGACEILPNCLSPTPYPAWCFPSQLRFLPGLGGTYLYTFGFVTVSSAAAASASGFAFFGFSTSGTLGFLGFIGIIIGVASLAGFQIFGSGLQGESINIMAEGALLLGLWLILAGLEGVGSPNDVFSMLNIFFGFGDFLLVLLSIFYLLGFAGIMSKSGI